jgi:hypothetical protein
MRARLTDDKIHLSCGASFFILSNEKGEQTSVNLVDVGSFGYFSIPMHETGMVPETSYRFDATVDYVLSNSFGFGGNCTCLIFSKKG